MTTNQMIFSNPFAQMMDLEGVIAAVERSERLQRLQSRICRPLDKIPLTAATSEEPGTELEAATELPVDASE